MQHTIDSGVGFRNQQREGASSLYTRARKQAERAQLRATFTGRSRQLFALEQVRSSGAVESQSDEGICAVPIDRICGSEGRSADFDCEFNPLREHNRDRWLRVAEARTQGKSLPPVALIQVGGRYFVRDGHHRISVAHTLGQRTIEARVVTWQVTGPLPWEASEQHTNLDKEGFIRCLRRRASQALREMSVTVGTTPRRQVAA